MSVEGQRWNFCFSIFSSLLSSNRRLRYLTDAPKAKQDVSGIFTPTVPGRGTADPGLIVPRATPLHDCLTVRKLGARPRFS